MSSFAKIPGFAYPGGKVRLRKWLVSMMPRSGRMYIEPFAGRGNVFWMAARCLAFEKWWLNDIWSKPFFDAIMNADLSEIPIALTRSDISDASRRIRENHASENDILIGPVVMFSGGVADSGYSSSMLHGNRSMANFRQTVRSCRFIMSHRNPRVTGLDWSIIISNVDHRDFLYLDPPYIDNRAGYSANDMNHQNLLDAIMKTRARWLLSGYPSDLYLDLLGKPYAVKRTKVSMSRTPQQGNRVECVWRNY